MGDVDRRDGLHRLASRGMYEPVLAGEQSPNMALARDEKVTRVRGAVGGEGESMGPGEPCAVDRRLSRPMCAEALQRRDGTAVLVVVLDFAAQRGVFTAIQCFAHSPHPNRSLATLVATETWLASQLPARKSPGPHQAGEGCPRRLARGGGPHETAAGREHHLSCRSASNFRGEPLTGWQSLGGERQLRPGRDVANGAQAADRNR